MKWAVFLALTLLFAVWIYRHVDPPWVRWVILGQWVCMVLTVVYYAWRKRL